MILQKIWVTWFPISFFTSQTSTTNHKGGSGCHKYKGPHLTFDEGVKVKSNLINRFTSNDFPEVVVTSHLLEPIINRYGSSYISKTTYDLEGSVKGQIYGFHMVSYKVSTHTKLLGQIIRHRASSR